MIYAVVQIGSRQYQIKPGQTIEVDKLPDTGKTFLVDKMLLRVDERGVQIGKPYLKDHLTLEILGNVKKDKIRVATYKAKANYRRVIGQRRQMTKLKLAEETKEKPKVEKASVKKS